MKIIVTGSLGNISKLLAAELVGQGHAVTVVSSDPAKQAAIEALGATAAIGSVTDTDFLAGVFVGADAVYAMIPPNFATDDVRGHYGVVGASYAAAVRRAGVARVVHLSSWGADQAEGTGFILGSHDVEELLDALPAAVAVTHLRAGYIYYNLLHFIGMIKAQGIIGANYGGDDRLVLAAPSDIAAAAAEELTAPAPGRRVRYVASDERTATEVARVLGAAIGRPELPWLVFTDEQTRAAVTQRGMPAPLVEGMVALNASIHNGALRQDYERHRPVPLGKVKVEDFAREFAAAFGAR